MHDGDPVAVVAVRDEATPMTSAERQRVEGFGQLADGLLDADEWYVWGPYLSERQWGTVREDYSADGEAWNSFPHDHARSRAYRWGEDGMAGFCDIEQRLCLGLALWNGRDPILKERMFGLTGAQANHGEDVKEYWWYLDAVPSHAWNRWRYHYPQSAFPYDALIAENGRRGKFDPEYELLDTGAFDGDRYWIVEVDYVKADPTDLIMVVRATNAGPETDTLHVLPTVWFRNTWSWDVGAPRPGLEAAADGAVSIAHPLFGDLELLVGPGPDGSDATLLFCENDTNDERLYGSPGTTPYPKDGINDHVVHGADTVNPARRGTKAAAWYRCAIPAGETVELRLRLRPRGSGPTAPAALGADATRIAEQRRREADDFYAELTPAGTAPESAEVMRQAFAGMLWSKQLYAYDIERWLAGDPTQPAPPASRRSGRNSRWTTFDAFDIMSMPDKWEYPWFAAWDMAFHCVALAHVDPAFAKYQLLLLCREWFQHPNGALPAYEWDFGDVNPPVQAWAALEVFVIDGAPRPGLPQHRLRQAARQLHVVGEPRRTPTVPTCSRAASSGSTTSGRSTARTCPSADGWSSPMRPGGWRSTRCRWPASPRSSTAPASARRRTSCSSSSSTSPRSAAAMRTAGVWDDDRRPLLRPARHARAAMSCR